MLRLCAQPACQRLYGFTRTCRYDFVCFACSSGKNNLVQHCQIGSLDGDLKMAVEFCRRQLCSGKLCSDEALTFGGLSSRDKGVLISRASSTVNVDGMWSICTYLGDMSVNRGGQEDGSGDDGREQRPWGMLRSGVGVGSVL